MAAVKFINFSRFSGSPLDAIACIRRDVCPAWYCAPQRYTVLCVSDDPYDGGLDRVGDDIPFDGLEAIERLIEYRSPFSLTYLAVPTRAEFVIGFHDIEDDGYMITATAESSIFYHKDDDYHESWRWFEGWLISLVIALGPSVCAFGNTRLYVPNRSREEILQALQRKRFIALAPEDVLDSLRRGELLLYPDPVFHALRLDLISPGEIRRLIKYHPHEPRLEYKIAPGYHILSNLR